MMTKGIYLLLACTVLCSALHAQNLVVEKNEAGAFAIVSGSQMASIVVDEADDSLVQKASTLFQKDIEMVTGKAPDITNALPITKNLILIGSIGKSRLIQQLIKDKKFNASSLKNKWEGYQIQLVKNPFKNAEQALVVAGSDRRGTAFGVFELSKQIGVSPWWWWADVPVKKKKEIFIKPAAFLADAPKVKYRGIFINDEAPALSGWSKEKFGGFNHLFYEKVFELILRLKGNYLWPAMWGNAFYDDDSLNKQRAETYGIVIGTSHHEPLMRAHDEWRRYGKGKWNYDSNEVRLKQFWKEGMQRVTNEKIVSIGMRGDGDEPMTEGTAIALLERIVADQRQIIEDVTKKPASETPQLWALYKEVQDYYDKGMRVPDDVTLLLCDDNWGNIRKLPKPTDKPRSGGYGIYYHFDYVGDPRNYKWINTNNLARVWEQMHLAYEHNVKNIWIVNVGDIKPVELPTSFFLDYAWNPDKWNEDNLQNYYTQWAGQQFGSTYAKEIGDILRRYSQYAARRKPELLDDKTYSLTDYLEWSMVVRQWKQLEADAESIDRKLPSEIKDAFFQLVLHPTKAFSNLHKMYMAVANNRFAAKRNFGWANVIADSVKEYYKKDSLLTIRYHTIANGKWNHMMDQTHIGYTYWQQPPVNKMPDLTYVVDTSNRDIMTASVDTAPVSFFPDNNKKSFFYKRDKLVSIEAGHLTKAINGKDIRWKIISDIGKVGSGVTTFPVTVSSQLTTSSPHIEYDFYTNDSGDAEVNLYFSPTLNFYNSNQGLQYAVSIDNEKPQVFSLNKDDKNLELWKTWVANNIIIKTSNHSISKSGRHTLKYWAISPAVILQKAVIDFGGMKPSYLGPPETRAQ